MRDSTHRNPQPLHRRPITFTGNCASAHHQQIESSQLFRYQELSGHTASIFSMEFSDDGTLLISGGGDQTVRLWSIDQDLVEWNSTAMETKHDNSVVCLAFSPDNQRIFSGGMDKGVLIHDTRS